MVILNFKNGLLFPWPHPDTVISYQHETKNRRICLSYLPLGGFFQIPIPTQKNKNKGKLQKSKESLKSMPVPPGCPQFSFKPDFLGSTGFGPEQIQTSFFSWLLFFIHKMVIGKLINRLYKRYHFQVKMFHTWIINEKFYVHPPYILQALKLFYSRANKPTHQEWF